MAGQITVSGKVLDPEVLTDMASAELTADLRFAPLAEVDTTLEGKPGSTVEFPAWNYVGDAEDLQEGVPISTRALTYGSKAATIKEIGLGIALTDQSVKISSGDPFDEAAKQLVMGVQNKIDNDCLEAFRNTPQTKVADVTLDGLQDVLDMYNLEDDEPIVAVVSPKAAGRIRLNAGKDWLRGSEIGAERIISGSIGGTLGVQFSRSRKLNAEEAIFIKPKKSNKDKTPLKLMLKSRAEIEPERHAAERLTNLFISTMVAPYLYDPTKVIKVTFNGVDGPAGVWGIPVDLSVNNEPDNVKEENKIGRFQKKSAKNPGNQKQEPNSQDQKNNQPAEGDNKKPGEV